MNKLQRTIKFRTWDSQNNEFAEWTNRDPFFSTSEGKIFFWERKKREDGSYKGDIILHDTGDRFILQQFTGLKDVNEKEIYEGDIAEVSYKMDEHGDPQKYRSEVVFENGAFGDKYDDFSNYLMLPSFTVEVVGNIFENNDRT